MNIRNIFENDTRQQAYDKLLDGLGLQRKGSADHTLANIGLFALGVAVGTSLGMLFAPKRGEELRSDAIHKIPGMRRELSGQEQIRQHASR